MTAATRTRAATAPPAADDAVGQVESELVALLRRARTATLQVAREVHPELEVGAYGILLRIDRGEAPTATQLAASLGVGKPTVSRQLASLERLGLIERQTSDEDRRRAVLRLTPEGRARLRATRNARTKHFRALLHTWPVEDVHQFADLLRRFNDLTR